MKQNLITDTKIILEQGKGEFAISLSDLPYLADHAFQGIIVLPGSAYVEMALVIYDRLFGKNPGIIKEISFENIIVLSEKATIIEFEVTVKSEENMLIRFKEKSKSGNSSATSLNVVGKDKDQDSQLFESDVIDFTNNAKIHIQSEEFYKRLSADGNQYGPKFQNIKEIWISEGKALGKLTNLSEELTVAGGHILHPSLLDSFTQLLSSLDDSNGKTFVLKSIDEINISNLETPDEVWCKANLSSNDHKDKNGFSGDLRIFDSAGSVYLELKNVRFKYLEQLDKDSQSKDKKQKICIASTFTANPLEDSLKFWSDQFKIPYRINFAPYNQVFQELLDTNSSLYKNQNGISVILLSLEDWAGLENSLIPMVSIEKIEELFKDKSKYTLPNKIDIVHLNKYETEYVYKEIFEDKVYLKHGITINDGDTVIDIGANIGLFTLFINQHCKNARVYSFEPSPVVYELLKTNSAVYGSNVKTFNCGVSDKKKTARFTFYKGSSVFSSFNANEAEDKDAIQAVVRNMLNDIHSTEATDLDEYVDEITNGRLESQVYDCPLISVSDIIKENELGKIDLLKIDAEKSELEIIKGISDSDWNKIRQIVIEIHDKTGNIFEEVKTILGQKGFQFEVEEEKFLKDSGLYNIYAKKIGEENSSNIKNNTAESKKEKLKENLEYFNQALNSFMNVSQAPMIVGVCKRSPEVFSDKELNGMFDEMENKLFSDIPDLPNVSVIKSKMVDENYPVEDYYDQHGNEFGHIPYTREYFTSLGTMLFRNIFSLKNAAHKVIALDCDNTLWKGVCGEDGVSGIQITDGYRKLQEFILDQINSGIIVCLCSKNNEEDVLDVFDKREDMILKREHLVSWKINWDLKSENLKSLAQELNLGLDSFIFIDDNPVECGEVKINCPEVLTLQLPEDDSVIPQFLNNIWAFDRQALTNEDKKRTKLYKENIQREKYRKNVVSLKDFLDGLKLQIKISTPTSEQLSRISQLTFRTNQFNFTTIRRTEAEVKTLLNSDGHHCLITEVSDRFGEYGLVGVLFYTVVEKEMILDTFLLSCRVLGRGVEYKILSELGKIAEGKNLETVKIKYIESSKNRPALDFINKIGSNFKTEIPGGLLFLFPADHLAKLTYEPVLSKPETNDETGNIKEDNKKIEKKQLRSTELSERMQHVADNLNSASIIHNNVEAFSVNETEPESPNFIQASTEMEKQVSSIWQKVLGKTKIGLNDNFFEIGGTSLKAVQLIATIKKELGINLSIVKLFECPTVGLLCEFLTENNNGEVKNIPEDIMERSKRRREKRIVRRR